MFFEYASTNPRYFMAVVITVVVSICLHELAHHLEPDGRELAPHGPEFCSRYLDLVDGVIGPEAALVLRTSLLGCGVRFG